MANWQTTRYEIGTTYIYIGYNAEINASDARQDWHIKCFTFDANGNPTRQDKKIGMWSAKESLFRR